VPTPERGRGGPLRGLDAVGADDHLWSAGSYYPNEAGSRTLILEAPSDREGAVVGDTAVAGATISWTGPEKGAVETDSGGSYQIGGLKAGKYTFIAAYPGCTPDSAKVKVVAGKTVEQDFDLDC
jgi:hypothetical protein